MGHAQSAYVTGELDISIFDLSLKTLLGTSVRLRRANVTAEPPPAGIAIDRTGPAQDTRVWCPLPMADGLHSGAQALRYRGLARGVVLEVTVNRITGAMTAVRVVRCEDILDAEPYPIK